MNEQEEKILSEVIGNISIDEIKSLKPTALVGRITSEIQKYSLKENRVIPLVQEAYIRIQVKQGRDRDSARQSWVIASGGDFEGIVRNHINEVLNTHGIVAIKGDLLKNYAREHKQVSDIVQFLMLPNKRRCTQTELKIWADSDVIVLAKDEKKLWKVLAVISCKTSDHSRNTSVLFWSLAFVQLGVKYFLATQDLDNQFNEVCEKAAKKQRRLFEAYCDRVFSTNPSTKYCSQVKSLMVRNDGSSDLTNELLTLANTLNYTTVTSLTVDELTG